MEDYGFGGPDDGEDGAKKKKKKKEKKERRHSEDYADTGAGVGSWDLSPGGGFNLPQAPVPTLSPTYGGPGAAPPPPVGTLQPEASIPGMLDFSPASRKEMWSPGSGYDASRESFERGEFGDVLNGRTIGRSELGLQARADSDIAGAGRPLQRRFSFSLQDMAEDGALVQAQSPPRTRGLGFGPTDFGDRFDSWTYNPLHLISRHWGDVPKHLPERHLPPQVLAPAIQRSEVRALELRRQIASLEGSLGRATAAATSAAGGHVRITVPSLIDGSRLGLSLDGLTVRQFSDPRAAHFGWALGDKILEVNGFPVEDGAEFQRAVARAADWHEETGTPLVFEVWRRPTAQAPSAWYGYSAQVRDSSPPRRVPCGIVSADEDRVASPSRRMTCAAADADENAPWGPAPAAAWPGGGFPGGAAGPVYPHSPQPRHSNSFSPGAYYAAAAPRSATMCY